MSKEIKNVEATEESNMFAEEKSERKLATIRRASEVCSIVGADNIDLVKVDGWQCVTRKNEFRRLDLGVYFEIDSYLPVEERYEFLRKTCFKSNAKNGDGFKLKTIKLRGQLSQGLFLPLSLFPEIVEPKEKMDVTELLKVKKYAPMFHAKEKMVGYLPSFVRKTDLERVQNCMDSVLMHKDKKFEVTIKLDGSSMTVYKKDDKFGVCSRNIDLAEDGNSHFWQAAKKYKFMEILKELGKNIAIQGELVGSGIQGNPENLTEQELFVFDIWNIDLQRYCLCSERMNLLKEIIAIGSKIGAKEILLAPMFDMFPLSKVLPANRTPFECCECLLRMAEGISSFSGNEREGLVFKCLEIIDGGNFYFKAISNKYLLGKKE
mgnify:CR=1 FL=1